MPLLWGADLRLPHSWQMSTIQDPRRTRLETGSLLMVRWRMPVSGRGCRSPLPSGSVCGMPASVSRVGRRALYTASYLSFCICSILCSVCRPGCLLEPFTGNSSSLCLSGDPHFGFLAHLSSRRLSSGHPGPALTLSTIMQPAPHCPDPAPWWRMGASGLLLHWHLQFGAYAVVFLFFVFPPSYVAL